MRRGEDMEEHALFTSSKPIAARQNVDQRGAHSMVYQKKMQNMPSQRKTKTEKQIHLVTSS